MHNTLRHIALITRREYLHRIRTKAFIITTLLTPALMSGFMFLPAFFMTQHVAQEKTIVIVSDDLGAAQSYASYLARKPEGQKDTGTQYTVTIDSTPTGAERQKLNEKVNLKEIDGYLWLTRDALKTGKVQYWARSTSDLAEDEHMQDALTTLAIKQRLAASGANNVDVDALMRRVDLQARQVGRTGVNPEEAYVTTFLAVLILYMTIIIHGVAVMRSVLEEKSSRVMEVLLSAVTPKELMAGKIIGVGAVGLTQIAIWAVLSVGYALLGAARAGVGAGNLHLTAAMGGFFVLFYLLGFLLYSSLSAALGAMVNSEEEAQQLQFFVVMPIIVALMLMGVIMRAPSSTISVVLSMVPFFAPILMYLRVVLEQPPAWQLILCTVIMIATIYLVLSLCARIYRVGILMYGKRPTLPEIMKWIRYA